jgi:hypothetical protein
MQATRQATTYSSVQEVLDDGKLAWEAQSQPLVTGAGIDIPDHKVGQGAKMKSHAWDLVSKFSV